MKLNRLTTQKLITLIETALNSDDREGQLDDNYSNLSLEEAMDILEMTETEAITYLESNGFYLCDPADVRGRGYKTFKEGAIAWLEEDTINAYFDMKEAEENKMTVINFDGQLYETTASLEVIEEVVKLVTNNSIDNDTPLFRVCQVVNALGFTIVEKTIPTINL